MTAHPEPLSDGDLESLLTIRHFELALLRMFEEGALNGTTHTCLGQECVPVAMAPLLAGDFVVSNHRSHGHYLAAHADPEGLLAEIMGRDGAVCNGVGGSQHLHRPGFLSTGVQGQGLPVAVGIALHHRNAGTGRVAAVYTGDGTWGEGAVYEGLNLASLWGVPLLVLVEHNGIAQSTPTGEQLAGDIGRRAAAFGVDFLRVSGQDVGGIRAAVAPVVHAVRTGHRPAVVQFDTHRLGPHSKGDDTRPPEQVAALRALDWHPRLAEALGERFHDADRRARSAVDAVVERVAARPPAAWAAPTAGVTR